MYVYIVCGDFSSIKTSLVLSVRRINVADNISKLIFLYFKIIKSLKIKNSCLYDNFFDVTLFTLVS